MKDKFLQLTLDAGSTRVLNCLLIGDRISQSSSPQGLLFQHRFLNKAILVKDREQTQKDNKTSSGRSHGGRNRIGLKMYFPFEPKDIYSGGQSIFFDPEHFQKTLIDTFGNIEGMKPDDYARDQKILTALQDIPTLDPFLVRDKLTSEGLQVDSRYLMIAPEEWKQIQHYIRNKIRPMVALALPDGLTNADEHVNAMIDAFWTAHDLKTLEPLITAFRLPVSYTKEIIYAWKGVAYFEYHYNHIQNQVIEFARWLGGNLFANIKLGKVEQDELTLLRDHIRQKTKDHLTTCTRILADYNDSYDKLFKRQESPTPFIAFLATAPQNFWVLGESIMRMMHCAETWKRSSQDANFARQDATALRLLLSALDDLI